jgi:hypothetical protein
VGRHAGLPLLVVDDRLHDHAGGLQIDAADLKRDALGAAHVAAHAASWEAIVECRVVAGVIRHAPAQAGGDLGGDLLPFALALFGFVVGRESGCEVAPVIGQESALDRAGDCGGPSLPHRLQFVA